MENKKFDKNITIILFNINSMNKKINELRMFVKQHQPHFLCITETKLKKKIPPRIEGYRVTFKNREALHPGGGVAIYYKENIEADEMLIETKFENVTIQTENIRITAAYNRPSSLIDINDLKKLTRDTDKAIIVGDFNAKHQIWNNTNSNPVGVALANNLENTDLHTVGPMENTRIDYRNRYQDAILDIAIVKNITAVTARTLNELSSDHLPVEFVIKQAIKLEEIPKFRNYKDVNWTNYRKSINNTLKINRNIISNDDIEKEIEKLTTAIQRSKEENIPRHNNKINITTTTEIDETIKNRNRARKIYQRTRRPEDREQLIELNQTVKAMINSAEEEKWQRKMTSDEKNKTSIFKSIKGLKQYKSATTKEIPPLKTGNNTFVTGKKEKAEFILRKLLEINQQTQHLSDEETIRIVEESYNADAAADSIIPDDQLANIYEIRRIIQRMRPFKAAGLDGIIPKDLKNLPKKALVQLHYIIRACLKNNYFPALWKKATIITIPKPNKPATMVENLRPITLISNLGKILERIIAKRINKDMENNGKYIEEQFGFRRGRSTTQQLARVVNYAMINNNMKNSTILATLDLEKAYDTVWRKALIYKMKEKIQIPGYITNIIKSFLQNRQIAVKIGNNTISEWKEQKEGLPQGSPLSPILFNIFINDYPKDNENNDHRGMEVALFADDIALYSRSTNERALLRKLQGKLTQTSNYLRKWKLKANPNKTQYIIINKKKRRNNTNIEFEGIRIIENDSLKYLGVTIDNRTNFKKQVQETRNKAGAAAAIIYPFIGKTSRLKEKTKLQIYNTYVASIMKYCYPIWSSTKYYIRSKLYGLENKLLRKITNTSPYARISNEAIYRKLNMRPLQQTHKQMTRKFFNTTTKKLRITEEIGNLNRETVPFRIKHPLIHQDILDDNDDN